MGWAAREAGWGRGEKGGEVFVSRPEIRLFVVQLSMPCCGFSARRRGAWWDSLSHGIAAHGWAWRRGVFGWS